MIVSYSKVVPTVVTSCFCPQRGRRSAFSSSYSCHLYRFCQSCHFFHFVGHHDCWVEFVGSAMCVHACERSCWTVVKTVFGMVFIAGRGQPMNTLSLISTLSTPMLSFGDYLSATALSPETLRGSWPLTYMDRAKQHYKYTWDPEMANGRVFRLPLSGFFKRCNQGN